MLCILNFRLSFVVIFVQSLCECRYKLIEQQTRLCSSENIDVEKVIATFQIILRIVPKEGTKATPIVQNVSREVEGWYNIMKTYFSFGKYRYVKFTSYEQMNELTFVVFVDSCILENMFKWLMMSAILDLC